MVEEHYKDKTYEIIRWTSMHVKHTPLLQNKAHQRQVKNMTRYEPRFEVKVCVLHVFYVLIRSFIDKHKFLDGLYHHQKAPTSRPKNGRFFKFHHIQPNLHLMAICNV